MQAHQGAFMADGGRSPLARRRSFFSALKTAGTAALVWAALSTAALVGQSTEAAAQDAYPTSPVRLIVPTPAGSFTDLVARVVAEKMSTELGQPFVIDNRPGASTNIGAAAVAGAAPDGYTVYFATNSNTMNVSLFKKLPFDIVKDFAPVAMAASNSFILVIDPKLPVNNLQELIAYAKAHPKELNFASTGNGSANHLANKMFEVQGGVEVTTVFYKGSVEAITDVMAGRASALFAPASSALGYIENGSLRAIGFTGLQRSALAPELPTMSEAGLPGYEIGLWLGFLAPAGTPDDRVTKLQDAVLKAVASQDVLDKFKPMGADPYPMNKEELAAFIQKDIARWAEAYKIAGVQPVD